MGFDTPLGRAPHNWNASAMMWEVLEVQRLGRAAGRPRAELRRRQSPVGSVAVAESGMEVSAGYGSADGILGGGFGMESDQESAHPQLLRGGEAVIRGFAPRSRPPRARRDRPPQSCRCQDQAAVVGPTSSAVRRILHSGAAHQSKTTEPVDAAASTFGHGVPRRAAVRAPVVTLQPATVISAPARIHSGDSCCVRTTTRSPCTRSTRRFSITRRRIRRSRTTPR